MSRILMAWELGGNLGHVVTLLAVARELRARGRDVVFALRDLAHAGLIARDKFAFFPAPVPVQGRRPHAYPSYAALLAGAMFPSAKAALVGALAWRSILRATRPHLLIADHAPMALLAARGLKLRTATLGVPFSIPVAGAALPVFLKGHADAPAEEERLLKRLNAALNALRAPRLEVVSDLYRTDATMVRTLPELDCFGPRPPASYVPPEAADASEAAPDWPGEKSQKALVYLQAGAWVRPVLETLARRGVSTIAYIGGLDKQRSKPVVRPGLHVSNVPFKASVLVRQADIVVCHGGHGMVTAAVLAGKPLVVLPSHLEQALTAQRVEKLGIGFIASGKADPAPLARCWQGVEPGAPAHARAAKLAARYPTQPGAGTLAEVVSRVERLLQA